MFSELLPVGEYLAISNNFSIRSLEIALCLNCRIDLRVKARFEKESNDGIFSFIELSANTSCL
ncbi:hypothetical protein ES705_13438 [subsurface metagenome]